MDFMVWRSYARDKVKTQTMAMAHTNDFNHEKNAGFNETPFAMKRGSFCFSTTVQDLY